MLARWVRIALGSWVKLAFLFNDTATTKIYTLSLHDALPISPDQDSIFVAFSRQQRQARTFALDQAVHRNGRRIAHHADAAKNLVERESQFLRADLDHIQEAD